MADLSSLMSAMPLLVLLGPVLDAMCDWGAKYMGQSDQIQ